MQYSLLKHKWKKFRVRQTLSRMPNTISYNLDKIPVLLSGAYVRAFNACNLRAWTSKIQDKFKSKSKPYNFKGENFSINRYCTWKITTLLYGTSIIFFPCRSLFHSINKNKRSCRIASCKIYLFYAFQYHPHGWLHEISKLLIADKSQGTSKFIHGKNKTESS